MRQLHYYILGVQTHNNNAKIVRGVIAHNYTEVKDIFKRCKRIFKYDKILNYKIVNNASIDLESRYNTQMKLLNEVEHNGRSKV